MIQTEQNNILRLEKQIQYILKLAATVTFAFFLCAILMGCSTWKKLDRTERGALIGGGTGAIVGGAGGSSGGALVGGATGAVAGGLIGHATKHDD